MRTHDVLTEFIGGIYHVRENSQNEEQEGLHPGRAHRRPGHPGHPGCPAVPALTGYIDKAREQSLISEGSLVLTAAQATVSEAYGTGDLKVGTDGAITVTNKSALASQINQLAELKAGASWKFDVVVGSETNYKSIKIKNLIYSDSKNSIAYNFESNWGSTQKGVALDKAQPVITPILDSTGK